MNNKKNSERYFPNELDSRNLVALPNKVWVMDLCQIRSKLTVKYKVKRKGEHRLKVFFVIDLGTREVILARFFCVLNSGNVRSTYIVRELKELIQRRGIHLNKDNQLIIHSDRGSEFMSNEYKQLFEEFPQCIGSMSAVASPRDNSVAERFVRTLKYQLPEGGVWPNEFESLRQAEAFLQQRVRFINETHKGKAQKLLPPEQMRHALEQKAQEAPSVIAHWAFKKGNVIDSVSSQIETFKDNAAKEWNTGKWSPETALKKTEVYAAVAARGAMLQAGVNDQVLNQLSDLKEAVSALNQKLTKAPLKSRRKELPLRDPVSETVYEFLMGLSRPKHISRYVWARNRVAITLLRFGGLRASDVAAITMKDINLGLRHGSFKVLQPKTNKYRIIVLTQSAREKLKGIQLDLKAVFGDSENKPLASAQNSVKMMGKDEWVRAINRFMQPAIVKFELILTSHSFRINYITRLLKTVPLQKVKKIVGHQDIRTTERYDRFIVDPNEVGGLVDAALNESDPKENGSK